MTRNSLQTLLADLTRSQRGSVFIELALLIPFLAFLSLGIVDIAFGFAAKNRLEQAASQTISLAQAKGPSASRYDYLVDRASLASGVPKEKITVDLWLECDRTRQPAYDGICAPGAIAARFVSVKIAGTYTPMINLDATAAWYGGKGMGKEVAIIGDAVDRVQ